MEWHKLNMCLVIHQHTHTHTDTLIHNHSSIKTDREMFCETGDTETGNY